MLWAQVRPWALPVLENHSSVLAVPCTPQSLQSPHDHPSHPTVTPWSPHGPHVPSQLDLTPPGEGQCESLSPDKYLLKLISFQGWIELQGALGHRFWWLWPCHVCWQWAPRVSQHPGLVRSRVLCGWITADTDVLSSPVQGFCSAHCSVLTFSVFVSSLILRPLFNLGQIIKLLVEILRFRDQSFNLIYICAWFQSKGQLFHSVWEDCLFRCTKRFVFSIRQSTYCLLDFYGEKNKTITQTHRGTHTTLPQPKIQHLQDWKMLWHVLLSGFHQIAFAVV